MTRRDDTAWPAPTEAQLDAYIAARCVEVGDCLEWQGAVTGGGPFFKTPRPHHRTVSVRRYKAAKRGPLPDKARMRVTTTCGNPLCVADEHITLAAPHKITRTAVKRNPHAWRVPARIAKLQALGRRTRGKLTVADVDAIRAASGRCRDIGAAFGVSASTVSAIRTHKRWRDVGGNPWAGLMRGVA